jgi:hypothetical protein
MRIKEQSGGEIVKIPAGQQAKGQDYCSTSPRDIAILNEPDRN